MKIPVLVTAVIAVGAGAFCWRASENLEAARGKNAKLLQVAAASGVAADSNNVPLPPVKSRERMDADAKRVVMEFFAFAEEAAAHHGDGGKEMDGEKSRRGEELLRELVAFDDGQWAVFIAEYRAFPDPAAERRLEGIAMLLANLSEEQPRAALRLFAGISDLFDRSMRRSLAEFAVPTSFLSWAESDLPGALAWIRENAPKQPDLLADGAGNAVLVSVARQDPREAFRVIGELGLKDPSGSAAKIVSCTRGDLTRLSEAIAGLREYLPTISDEKLRAKTRDQAFRRALYWLADAGFDSASQWLKSANADREEKAIVADQFAELAPATDAGKWIEWIHEAVPGAEGDAQVGELMRNWTQKDHAAAAEWLKSAPDSPARRVAVSAFAEKVAAYEPESAEQWALTLPEGPEREKTLRGILARWPKAEGADAGAEAAAFAERHGLEGSGSAAVAK